MSKPDAQNNLSEFGFLFGKSGPHTARTIMLEELELLMGCVSSENPSRTDFQQAIVEENCLSKRSGKTRELTFRHLTELYALDASVPLFRVMLMFWRREEEGHALLAVLCAFPRDSILRQSFEWVSKAPVGTQVMRESIEVKLAKEFPDRFSSASLKSIAQNLNATWTKTGHLSGKVRKIRRKAVPTPASTAFALYLGYLTGLRGEALFRSPFCRVLDAPAADLMDKAEAASRRGWIVMKRLGSVIEVLFPNLITPAERRLLDEQ